MKNIIKLTAIVLILLILASCAPAVEPTGTGATTGTTNTATSTADPTLPDITSDPTTQPTETGTTSTPSVSTPTPEETVYNTVYHSYLKVYNRLFVTQASSSQAVKLCESLQYYLENFAPDMYKRYTETIEADVEALGYSTTYDIVNTYDVPEWLTRELLLNSGYSKDIIDGLVNALYTCKTEEEFKAFFDENYVILKKDCILKQFVENFSSQMYAYVSEFKFVDDRWDVEREYEKWFYSRSFRHSEILEQYMGLSPEWIIESHKVYNPSDPYITDYLDKYMDQEGVYEQISIPEYIYEFNLTHLEFLYVYYITESVFEGYFPGEATPHLEFSKITGTDKSSLEEMIVDAKTPQNTYEINYAICYVR